MPSFQTIAVACGLAASASAHVLMNTPVPYQLVGAQLDNSPIDANGDNFPCKLGKGVSFNLNSAANTMALGSQQPLKFTGSAVHGGGSCQISLTYDDVISGTTVWKVIHSIEGGCPAENQTGNLGDNANMVDPYDYSFTIPTDIPTGNATLAWTWFNKIGNREMYMNCAPVSLTGTSGSQSSFEALPDMFVANIGNGCGTQDSKDLLFPDPGDSLEQLNGATSAFASATGSCGPATAGGSATVPGSAAAGATGAAAAGTSAAAATSPAVAATTTAAAGGSGGIFVTVPSSAAAMTTQATMGATSAAVQPTETPATSTPGSGSSSGSGSGSTNTTTPSGTLSGACTNEGEWNCIGGTSFQQCASGQWSVVMPLAAGTSCTSGMSAELDLAATSRKARKARRGRLAVPFRG